MVATAQIIAFYTSTSPVMTARLQGGLTLGAEVTLDMYHVEGYRTFRAMSQTPVRINLRAAATGTGGREDSSTRATQVPEGPGVGPTRLCI